MSDKQSISDALGVPFPRSAIQIHPQTKMKYVEGHTYIHRLNDATGNTWDWKIVRQDFHPYGATAKGNARLLITVIGELTIPGLGTRSGMGVQVVTADTGGEDMWKGAMTDAIKAAAKLFGVGLELYGPDYEAGEMPALPNRNRSTSQNTVPDAPPPPVTNKAPAEPLPGLQLATPRQKEFIQALAKELGFTPSALDAEAKAAFGGVVAELNRRDASILVERLTKRRNERPAAQAQMIDTTDASARARN